MSDRSLVPLLSETEGADLDEAALGDTLYERSRAIVATPDLALKVSIAYRTARDWFGRRLARGSARVAGPMPSRPGRPARPLLVAPRDMPRRSRGGDGSGKIALVHSLAHIELNAVDLT